MKHPVCLFLLPWIVFVALGAVMHRASGRARVHEMLAHAAPEDRRTPGMRLSYDAAAVQRHWAALDADGLRREKRFFQLDLAFPVFFAAAFAYSLLSASQLLPRPIKPAYLLVPVVLMLFADWTENITLLGQLQRFTAGQALQPGQVRVASHATQAKLLLVGVLTLSIAGVLAAAPRDRGNEDGPAAASPAAADGDGGAETSPIPPRP